MKESTINKHIKDYLDNRPRCWYFKTHGNVYQLAGLPDFIGCDNGRFFGLESKVPGKQTTPLQAAIIRKIIAAGGIAGRVESVDDVIKLLM